MSSLELNIELSRVSKPCILDRKLYRSSILNSGGCSVSSQDMYMWNRSLYRSLILNFDESPVRSLELNIDLWRVSNELTGHVSIR